MCVIRYKTSSFQLHNMGHMRGGGGGGGGIFREFHIEQFTAGLAGMKSTMGPGVFLHALLVHSIKHHAPSQAAADRS